MTNNGIQPSGVERFFDDDEVIVSKTDPRGVITYANRVFERVSGYDERELIGRPHNLIRHPAMPRCVFKLLWDLLRQRREVFAYVVNMARNGDHYWVFAHVTPSYDREGQVVGYHSNRRVPAEAAVRTIKPLYDELLTVEQQHADSRAGMLAAEALLVGKLAELGMPYEQFVFALSTP